MSSEDNSTPVPPVSLPEKGVEKALQLLSPPVVPPRDRDWFTFFLMKPNVESTREWFDVYETRHVSDQNVWLLSLTVQMTRSTHWDKDFWQTYDGAPGPYGPLANRLVNLRPKIVGLPSLSGMFSPSMYINPTKLTFQTLVTPLERYTFKQFIGEAGIVKKIEALFPPTNEFYINEVEMLCKTPDGKYHVATFEKNEKATSEKVKEVVKPSLVGNTTMTVDLTKIEIDIKPKKKTSKHRILKPYETTKILKRPEILDDPRVVLKYLGVLYDEGFINYRDCYGNLAPVYKPKIAVCGLGTSDEHT